MPGTASYPYAGVPGTATYRRYRGVGRTYSMVEVTMPRPRRLDSSGRFHHITNRGLHLRSFFDIPSDKRKFLNLLEHVVKERWIRIHSFVLMSTHFHFVAESLDGGISVGMQWLQTQFTKFFNRTRARTGTMVNNRFHSVPILSLLQMYCCVRYGDYNPVKAKLCADPLEFEFGSAAMHARIVKPPSWLCTRVIDQMIAYELYKGTDRISAYRNVFHPRTGGNGAIELIERRLNMNGNAADDLDELVASDRKQIRNWLRRRAKESDGGRLGLPMANAASALAAIDKYAQCIRQSKLTGAFRRHSKRRPCVGGRVASRSLRPVVCRDVGTG